MKTSSLSILWGNEILKDFSEFNVFSYLHQSSKDEKKKKFLFELVYKYHDQARETLPVLKKRGKKKQKDFSLKFLSPSVFQNFNGKNFSRVLFLCIWWSWLKKSKIILRLEIPILKAKNLFLLRRKWNILEFIRIWEPPKSHWHFFLSCLLKGQDSRNESEKDFQKVLRIWFFPSQLP